MELRLPDIGEGLTEAEIVRWLVAVGDRVREDQPIVEIQTDKAVTEMPAPATGVVATLGGGEGDLIRVGEVLVVIDDGNGAVPAPAVERAASSSSSASAVDERASRPKATPATRGLARRLGVELSSLTGTGPGGRITPADVEAATGAAGDGVSAATTTPLPPPTVVRVPAAAAADERVPFRGLRRRTAENLSASWQQIPHVSSFVEADVTDLFALRGELKPLAEERGISLTLTALFVKATALGLRRFRMMNASLDTEAGEIIVRARRNIAVAVNTDDGLVLPVVNDADAKPVLAIARELQDLTAQRS